MASEPWSREVAVNSTNTDGKCQRCHFTVEPSFMFCVNCGQQLKAVPQASIAKQQNGKAATPPLTSSGSKRKPKLMPKQTSSRPVEPNISLSLPMAIIEGINKQLSEPILNNTIIARRLAQQFQTQVLEVQNATGVEEVAHIRLQESLALDTNFSRSEDTSEPIVFSKSVDGNGKLFASTVSYQASKTAPATRPARTKGHNRRQYKRSSDKKAVSTYLDDVESVATHYDLYMKRLKQLEGLRAALLNPPALPSELLQRRDGPHFDRALSDMHQQIVTGAQEFIANLHAEPIIPAVPTIAADPAAVGEAYSTSRPASAPRSPPATHNDTLGQPPVGQAFMWGPIFSAEQSVASTDGVDTVFASDTAAKVLDGVIRLDASQVLGASPPSLGQSSATGIPSRRNIRPLDGVGVGPEEGARAAEEGPIGLDEKEPAPVVMFWGNLLQSDLQPEVEVSTPNRPSRSASFRSRTSSARSGRDSNGGDHNALVGERDVDEDSGGEFGDIVSDGEYVDPEEAELPAWIEALAAETASIREEFLREDEGVMRRVDERLRALDVASTRLQSRRALVVQYSMDGVVQEYREKIRRMKVEMGIAGPDGKVITSPSKPGTAGDRAAVSARFSLAGTEQEETRAVDDEAEEAPRPEAPQGLRALQKALLDRLAGAEEHDEGSAYSQVLKLHRRILPALRGALPMERGQIFELIERQESKLAAARGQAAVDDERAMQELIEALTEHHLKQFPEAVPGNDDGAVEAVEGLSAHSGGSAKPSAATDTTARDATVRRELLERQEARESVVRDERQRADALAMQQWLVAVTAQDASRALRAAMRTLHMEEMEDSLAGSDGEDDDENGEGGESSEHKKGERGGVDNSSGDDGEDGERAVASAEIEVPPNSSMHKIKDVYRQSCSKMLALLPGLDVDFTTDQTAQPGFRTEARSKVLVARRVLKVSAGVDHRAATEYRAYLDHCALRRTALALRISEAMLRASELEKAHRARYAQAKQEHQQSLASSGLVPEGSGDPSRHVSKHMRAIQKSAELELAQQGDVVKALQAQEAKLILDIRQEQFVLSEVLALWQTRHSRALQRFSLAYKRFSGLLESVRNAAQSTS